MEGEEKSAWTGLLDRERERGRGVREGGYGEKGEKGGSSKFMYDTN